jgi:hypothetical protein
VALRKKAPMPLDTLRRKVSEQGSDIAALKAGIIELQQRMAKVETGIGKAWSGEMPPNVERQDTRDETGE